MNVRSGNGWRVVLAALALVGGYGTVRAQQTRSAGAVSTRTPAGWHRHSNGGGLVQNTATVETSAFVGANARVYERARVTGNARITENARVFGNAIVTDDAVVGGNATVSGAAMVYDHGQVVGKAKVAGTTVVRGSRRIDK